MTAEIIVAGAGLIGAFTGLVALCWEVHKWRLEQQNIQISHYICSPSEEETKYLILTFENTGQRPVRIQQLECLYYSNWFCHLFGRGSASVSCPAPVVWTPDATKINGNHIQLFEASGHKIDVGEFRETSFIYTQKLSNPLNDQKLKCKTLEKLAEKYLVIRIYISKRRSYFFSQPKRLTFKHRIVPPKNTTLNVDDNNNFNQIKTPN